MAKPVASCSGHGPKLEEYHLLCIPFRGGQGFQFRGTELNWAWRAGIGHSVERSSFRLHCASDAALSAEVWTGPIQSELGTSLDLSMGAECQHYSETHRASNLFPLCFAPLILWPSLNVHPPAHSRTHSSLHTDCLVHSEARIQQYSLGANLVNSKLGQSANIPPIVPHESRAFSVGTR